MEAPSQTLLVRALSCWGSCSGNNKPGDPSDNSLRAGLFQPFLPGEGLLLLTPCASTLTYPERVVLLPGMEHPHPPLAVRDALIVPIALPVSVLLIPFGHLALPSQTSAPALAWTVMVSADVLQGRVR